MRRLALLIACLAAAAITPGPAQAYTAPCRLGNSGPTCHFKVAHATKILDGDTIVANVPGEGRNLSVRLSSIQAMEQKVYSGTAKRRQGECHALEATLRVERLIKRSHWKVLLSSQNPHAMADVRLRRSMAVRVHGRWKDLGSILMSEGLTLWLPGRDEYAWNATYDLLGQQARQKGIGMWNPTHCGVGPHQNVPLRMWVNWDPPGIDQQAVDKEWVKIQNLSATTTLPLGRWWIRDSDLRRLTFPPNAQIPPGGTITVYTGHGTNSASSFFWNFDHPLFDNPGDYHNQGDGAYLFDPQGDLRLAAIYPCLVACTDPLEGAVQTTVQPRDPEYVDVRNVADRDVDLYGYLLESPGYQYIFDEGSVLHPGERMRIYIGGDPSRDTQLVRYSGENRRRFADSGGSVLLKNFADTVVDCDSWGGGHC